MRKLIQVNISDKEDVAGTPSDRNHDRERKNANTPHFSNGIRTTAAHLGYQFLHEERSSKANSRRCRICRRPMYYKMESATLLRLVPLNNHCHSVASIPFTGARGAEPDHRSIPQHRLRNWVSSSACRSYLPWFRQVCAGNTR
ncbi:hypothetical protein CEXT_258661 [Caerostris extrusa]|uniref:Uncharacterized protein n=1 Tax=Caerostris extrusa TaxID=172846 RepID=A0AAV4M2S9_CAEEX|nr:hypothetical protein CEXT_258661 [Caerostris extrusa]